MTPPKQTSTKNPKRGDIVLVPFPNSNLRTAKVRPALIIQGDNLHTGLAQVVVAMITSQTARAHHPCRVKILLATPEGRQFGLLVDSVVMADNLATIELSVILRIIGNLPLADVDNALRHTLNL